MLAFLIRLSPFYEDQLVPLLRSLAGGRDVEGQVSGRREVEGAEGELIVGRGSGGTLSDLV